MDGFVSFYHQISIENSVMVMGTGGYKYAINNSEILYD